MGNERRRVACLMAVAMLLCGCGPELDDRERILHTLDAMTEAVEAGEVGDFMAPVADDFVAVNGRLDRRALGLLVRRERLARDSIRVRRVDTKVELVGESRAVASFRALATGGSGLLPDEGRFWRVETGWRRDGDEWALISAEWE